MEEKIDNLDLAWAAGIMDGEGSITILNSSIRRLKNGHPARYPQLNLWLSNYDPKMVLKFKQWFGGTYYILNRRDRRKPIHCWCAACKKAENALRLLLPYLVTKKEQAELALLFRDKQKSRKNLSISLDGWEEESKIWIKRATELKV